MLFYMDFLYAYQNRREARCDFSPQDAPPRLPLTIFFLMASLYIPLFSAPKVVYPMCLF